MDARLERKLRLLAGIIVFGAVAGVVFNFAQGRLAARARRCRLSRPASA